MFKFFKNLAKFSSKFWIFLKIGLTVLRIYVTDVIMKPIDRPKILKSPVLTRKTLWFGLKTFKNDIYDAFWG